MLDIIRDSTVGGLINTISHGRFLPFPDQREDFQIPERYLSTTPSPQASKHPSRSSSRVEHSNLSRGLPPLAGHDEKTLSSDSAAEHSPPSKDSQQNKGADTTEYVLVDWYGEDDPENPRNWSLRKRIFVTAQIAFLTYAFVSISLVY